MDEPCKRSLKFKMLRQAQHDKYLYIRFCHSDEGRIPRIETISFSLFFCLKIKYPFAAADEAWRLR